ncbi:3910_t:CDS:2 [Ambispora gerdemannii]|uniref:3910_t:CDS:1 n=1 Tax=Ambispora gerdemannii TaxID=144530 RepID=A0A9N9GR54_9GLOM|nr:3910_t:CDS:2 [Ambispora gerdemannii]
MKPNQDSSILQETNNIEQATSHISTCSSNESKAQYNINQVQLSDTIRTPSLPNTIESTINTA